MNNNVTKTISFAFRKMGLGDLKYVRDWYEKFSLPGQNLADGGPVNLLKLFTQRERYLICDTGTNLPVGVFCINEGLDCSWSVTVGFGERQYNTEGNLFVLEQQIKVWMKRNFPDIEPQIAFV